MLQHDYIEEMIHQFIEAVADSLTRLKEQPKPEDARQVEDAIAGLIDLDPQVALNLAPDSLVTMMLLSGVGDSVASYVCWCLQRLSDAYASLGDDDKADVRRAQAEAVAESFNVDSQAAPEGLASE